LNSILNGAVYFSRGDLGQVEHFSQTQTLWQHPSSAAALSSHKFHSSHGSVGDSVCRTPRESVMIRGSKRVLRFALRIWRLEAPRLEGS